MSRISSSFIVLALGLSACGGVGGVCNRADDVFGVCEGSVDVDTCKDNGADCTGDDIDKMNAYIDCWEDAGLGCPEDIGTDDVDAMASCAAELDGLSEACTFGA
jgi:hypothetical protein